MAEDAVACAIFVGECTPLRLHSRYSDTRRSEPAATRGSMYVEPRTAAGPAGAARRRG